MKSKLRIIRARLMSSTACDEIALPAEFIAVCILAFIAGVASFCAAKV